MQNVSSSNSQAVNVPKLRFPGFEGAWEQSRLDKFCDINPKTDNIPDEFYYIDLESVVAGVLEKEIVIKKADAPSRAQRLLTINDVLFQTVRPYQKNNYFFDVEKEIPSVASTGYAQLRTSQNANFLYQLINTQKFTDDVLIRCTGSSYPAINSNDMKEIVIKYPSIDEQNKIANFLKIVDSRIEKQQELVDALKLYKRGAVQHIFKDMYSWKSMHIKDVAKINTGSSNTQDSNPNGSYPFFIRSQNIARSKKYLYDCEAVLTIGDGQIGKVFHYINGKFDCHQRVYMMSEFKENIIGKYFYHYFSAFFFERAMKMSAKNTVDSVRLEMISDMPIYVPTIETQHKIISFLDSIDLLIEKAEYQVSNVNKFKNGLLQQMFI